MIHPTQLPPGPEYDAWLDAEADYSCKHDPPLKVHKVESKAEPERKGSWLHRFCAWVMQ